MSAKHKPVVIVRKRSWPAVSQICSLIRLPSSSIVLILKSMLLQVKDQINAQQKIVKMKLPAFNKWNMTGLLIIYVENMSTNLHHSYPNPLLRKLSVTVMSTTNMGHQISEFHLHHYTVNFSPVSDEPKMMKLPSDMKSSHPQFSIVNHMSRTTVIIIKLLHIHKFKNVKIVSQ